ncbi:F-box/LRR-repeat protein At4g14103-like [Vigna radiata var. radiata]|uniref:F-box/LRR-repeat protein At4g14103-like n=1 Tax=Vigna radiata var. radiata TaxID=3916 RepID=A0A1S3U0C8_VIGRR|nr:F-box/LRR-repeat protein At4g14103-like [Vigna radiata var. radiata]XP_022636055.1 F-box/LRR-repeat protein At4g14103-like [Vigna radiata var. radiata]XP_022636056.1 F-box/LRR-repeat protein At4g14103-like [Vigna radiata var. radiata]
MTDLISSLLDEIICYILSFVPSQQVVATSVLSKRWNILWPSVPSFDFDIFTEDFWSLNDEKTYNTFYSSVASFLVRRGDQPLHRFRLRSDIFFDDSKLFNKWIMDAVSGSGRLQHLDLFLSPRIVVPSVLFSCKTLVVLKLEYIRVESISLVDLPLIKVLHLNYIFFLVGVDLSQLLTGSPYLEVLKVMSTKFLPKEPTSPRV